MSGSGSSRRGARHGGYAANSFRTEAIVLRTHRLGEADRIIEALTPEHGLVRAVAKGVRKTSSRLGSVVEPFMHSTLQLARGRGELHTVSQAQLLHPYATMLAADYDAYTVAGALAARGWPNGVRAELTLAVTDPLLPDNAGRYRVEVADGEASVERTGDAGSGPADIELGVDALATLYSGHLGPGTLAGLGRLRASPEALATATTLFAGPRPWLADMF